jgi:hypothetical protein
LQKITVFVLKTASAMMLFLVPDILDYYIELARAHRERGITTLPVKPELCRRDALDPFRGCLLECFHHAGLGVSTGKGEDDMNVIGYAADSERFRAKIAASRRKISVHSGPTSVSSHGSRSFVLKMM